MGRRIRPPRLLPRAAIGVCAGVLLLLIGTSIHGQSPSGDAPDPAPPESRVRQALEARAFADAERLALQRVAAIEAQLGAASLEAAQASDLAAEAQLKAGHSNSPDTLARAERTVAVKERLLGHTHPDVAISLHTLGTLRVERGEYEAALPHHQRALAIRRAAFAGGHPLIADSLERLALPLIYLERFTEARAAVEEARRTRAADAGAASMPLARAQYLTALLHRWEGNYTAAATALDAAMAAFRSSHATADDVVAATQLRGDLHYLGGDVQLAQAAWSEALGDAERDLGANHPVVPRLLRVLAAASKDAGDLTRADNLLQRAHGIADRVLAPCHKEIPTLLNDRALLVAYKGDYSEARRMYARALATSERCLGPAQSLTATIVHNRAALAVAMGDLAEAERLNERAVQAWSAGVGADHPYVARGLDALADVVAATGRVRRARAQLERALAIRRRALGPDHPDVAVTLLKLARVASQSGEPALAFRRVEEALAIYEEGGLPQDPDYLASAVEMRGDLHARAGDAAAARSDYARVLAARERIFGAAHPLTARARVEVASTDFALSAWPEALRSALAAEQVGRDHLRLTIQSLPERQALEYAERRPRGLDLAVSLAAADRVDQPGDVLDAVIRSRGVILDELAARTQSIRVRPDAELPALLAAVASARSQYANLMLRSVTGDDPVAPAALQTARERKEAAERALAERSESARAELSRTAIGLGEVRSHLPGATALVSYVRYDRTIVPSGGRALARAVPSYVAFVVAPGAARPAVVALGPAASLEAVIQDWRAEAGRHGSSGDVTSPEEEQAYRAAGVRLRRRIWDPLVPHVGQAAQVFVVPDGAITMVSFAALPTPRSRYLVEDGPLVHVLTTERDVVPDADAQSGFGLLAVGGPMYGAVASEAGAAAPVTTASGCDRPTRLQFEDLPGARAETLDIARIWTSARRTDTTASEDAGGGATVLNGRAATTAAVLQSAAHRRVVHFATHGFFLGAPCGAAPRGTRGVGGLVGRRATPSQGNPLLASGLAFAGANRPASAGSGHDDGILTADEVASLDLRGTEWAVLSACDTGLGEIRTGEGIFGLRRAFQIAGARTVITSLWAVGDQSTRQWMRALYEGRLQHRLTTAEAVHRASLEALRDRRARGQTAHPFYWGAFVAAGDWR